MKSKTHSLVIAAFLLTLIYSEGLCGCRSFSGGVTTSLQLEEHPLAAPPDPDQGIFQPVGTTQDEVLERHQLERARTVLNPVSTGDDYHPVMTSLGEGEPLKAVLKESPTDPPRMLVDLVDGEEVIFSVGAGLPSPVLPLQSLWSYDDHWTLEILLADEDVWQGQLYQDGQLINETKNYQDAFGFQLMAGKPFYFFRRDAKLGYFYDGQETALPYDQIPHYGCCSASTLNPLHAENMVAFYAQTGEKWFYVELGAFEME